jgi:predicted transcriptional regulator
MMHRSRHSIIMNILETCKKGSTKTRIVYQANLNFKTAIPYIGFLLKNGFLEMVQEKNVLYITTNKGKVMLDKLKEVNMDLIEEQENETSDTTASKESVSKEQAIAPV